VPDGKITKMRLTWPRQGNPNALSEQLRWLIDLRWMAIGGIVVAILLGHYVFSVLNTVGALYACAGLLLVCNVIYYGVVKRIDGDRTGWGIALGVGQMEMDLVILTSVLFFSGGMTNPFTLFYVFHVIIAAMILPKQWSLVVMLTAVACAGFLTFHAGGLGAELGAQALRIGTDGGLWASPTYIWGNMIAFTGTMIATRYLTRIIIVRMQAKETEAAHHHDLLQAVVCAMNEGVIFVNQHAEVVFCNPAADKWKNRICDQTGGEAEVFPPVLQDHLQALAPLDGPQGGQASVIEFETARPNVRYIEARQCPVQGADGGGLGHVIVGSDLTEHKTLERELTAQTEKVTAVNEMLKMSRVRMAQREKMVAIGQMAAGIAHEIGNPLASLSSVAQYLERKAESPEFKEQLGVIQSQVDRISTILKRMLTFSRPAAQEYRWSDLDALIENTLSLVKFDKRMRQVTVKNEVRGDLPTVWLNPQNFEQVLINVFINAMDAMDTDREDANNHLEITRAFDGEVVELRIRDTGMGMSQEVADRAFESFYTTKAIGKGSGLGLFVCHNLITELAGSIQIESESGQGATVIIRIPVQPQADLLQRSTGKAVKATKHDNLSG
jgi:signal transduction histidine kinase